MRWNHRYQPIWVGAAGVGLNAYELNAEPGTYAITAELFLEVANGALRLCDTVDDARRSIGPATKKRLLLEERD